MITASDPSLVFLFLPVWPLASGMPGSSALQVSESRV